MSRVGLGCQGHVSALLINIRPVHQRKMGMKMEYVGVKQPDQTGIGVKGFGGGEVDGVVVPP